MKILIIMILLILIILIMKYNDNVLMCVIMCNINNVMKILI